MKIQYVIRAVSARLVRLAPYLLALFFALWGLRGVTCNNIVFNDAARHAMNGVFVHDLIRDGKFTTPIEYGRYYYSRLPALSLPYHPPLFPMIESVFFFIFGVNVLAARLAIALATAISVMLFYRLIIATHNSYVLAIASTITFFSMKLSQSLANEVMLEFPSLAFILGALYCLRDLDHGYPLRRGLLFAVLAAAAVWTKQQAVFLGMVPFFCIVISRRWRLLAGKTIWISSLLFAGLVIALVLLSKPFGNTGVNQVTAVDYGYSGFIWSFRNNSVYYLKALQKTLGVFLAVPLAAVFVIFLFAPRRREPDIAANDLYLAWALSVFAVLLLVGSHSTRYLFYLYPALIVIGYAGLLRLCVWFLSSKRVWYIPVTVAGLYFILHLNTTAIFMHGPSQAAAHVVTGTPSRVLYCGQTDGSFIFSVRSLDPELHTVVIRGDKLPASTFADETFEGFAHRYGINYIVLEYTKHYSGWKYTEEPSPWNRLLTSTPSSMVLERVMPLDSSTEYYNGNLYVYRFTNPSPNPENTLTVPSLLLGGDVKIEF